MKRYTLCKMQKIAFITLLIATPISANENTITNSKPTFEYRAQKSNSESSNLPQSAQIPIIQNGKKLIDKNKGSISFYLIVKKSPGLSNQVNTTQNLFKLGESAQQFKIILYQSPLKTYLEFRHDATDNCLGVQCQRSVSTSSYEPKIVQTWRLGERHHIVASWNFNTSSPAMNLYVDGKWAITQTKSPNTSYASFNPKHFYIDDKNVNEFARIGLVDELKIYENEFLSAPNKIAEYAEWKRDNGIWDNHERYKNTHDAPKPVDLIGLPYTVYITPPFTKIYDASLPLKPAPHSIEFDMVRSECETRFFNIYTGDNPIKEVQVSISDLTNGSARIKMEDIPIRVTHNWWQASEQGAMKAEIPSYTPELMLFNEIDFNSWQSKPAELPENKNTGIAKASIDAHSSKQFSIRLCTDNNTTPADYLGDILITHENSSVQKIPVRTKILPITLPKLSPVATIYHESRFDISPKSDSYVSANTYKKQLDNIKQHGFNGIIVYGSSADYVQFARESGLTNFICFASTVLTKEKTFWMTKFGFKPVFLGEDEIHLFPERTQPHIKLTNQVHNINAFIASAMSKSTVDKLATLKAKTDYPILDLENAASTGDMDYFNKLLAGLIDGNKNELIYWQATDENPLKNRFYAGYFLFISRLGGIAPYVYQKIRGDAFDDFSELRPKERSLNLAYPSKGELIDTLQWEALREGLDDYRLLDYLKNQLISIAKSQPNKSTLIKGQLDRMLTKYKSIDAYKTLTPHDFDSDRTILIKLINDIVNGK